MISMHKCSSFFTSIALNSIRILKDSTNVSDIEDEYTVSDYIYTCIESVLLQ